MLADGLEERSRLPKRWSSCNCCYARYPSEGRSREMSETLARMRVIDPSAEPRSGGGTRNLDQSELVFSACSRTTARAEPPAGRRCPARPPPSSAGPAPTPRRASGRRQCATPPARPARPRSSANGTTGQARRPRGSRRAFGGCGRRRGDGNDGGQVPDDDILLRCPRKQRQAVRLRRVHEPKQSFGSTEPQLRRVRGFGPVHSRR